MTDLNGPQFQPPQFQPPTVPPAQQQPVFGAPPASGPPTTPIEVAPPASNRKRSKGVLVGAAVAVLALVGAGVFALTRIGGDDDKGGAASPTEAGENLVNALNQEDILGVVDVLLPGERETFRQPLIDLVDNLKRLDVLGGDADASSVKGIDIELADAKVTADKPVAEDITNIHIAAEDESSVDGKNLPLGDIIVKEALGGEKPSTRSSSSGQPVDLTMTTVEKDGRWYVSLFYSIAENARQDRRDSKPVPDEGVALAGADQPEEAVDQMVKAATELDVERIIGGLNPNEAEALQRYAPLFLDSADERAKDLDATITFSDATYDVSGSGSHRHVTISEFQLSIEADGETMTAAVKGGCAVVTTPDGETVETCKDGKDITKTLDDAGFGGDLSPEVDKLITTVQDAFADFDPTGIAVDQVDGKWYVSPIATGFDFLNGALGALDGKELQDIIDAAKNIDVGGIAIPDIGAGSSTAETIPVPTMVPDTVDTVPDTVEETFPPVTDGSAATTEDFRTETEAFIAGDEVTDHTGLTFTGVSCAAPASTDVGTTYRCFAWADGTQYQFTVEITSVDGFTVQEAQPV
ncbi:MAG: DUF4333 domain-containing protein [Ilumatobacteraceae bacterium]